MQQVLLPIHIVAGGLAIILGGLALVAAKGGWLHRKSGLLFVFAMVTMGFSGSFLAIRQGWLNPNIQGGLMSAYFVGTALTAVRPPSAWSRRLDLGALFLAFGLALFDLQLALQAMARPRFALKGVPGPMILFLMTIMLLAAFGDVRVMRSGALRGAARLRRHLWRMCFALFIAAGSFFSIRERVAKILPEPFLSGPMRALPVLLVFFAMFYWMWRLRGRARHPAVAPS